jgi:L-lactate dehydrogenase complex protein LldG
MVGSTMTSAKDAILSRIRTAVQSSPSRDIIERRYRQADRLDLQIFEDRLIDYGVRVYRSIREELRTMIATALTNAGKQRVLIPRGFPMELLPENFQFVVDAALSYEQLDYADGVLTTCALAVAETGTIFLRHTEAEGRRALTLIPDYHLCIIHASQVVATLPEGIRLAALFGNVPTTTISGPSATSDIEMTRVKGVHGPRILDVILNENRGRGVHPLPNSTRPQGSSKNRDLRLPSRT